MSSLLNIGFFGNFEKAFEELPLKYNVEFVVFEINKENLVIKETCKRNNIKVFLIESKNDIYNVIQDYLDIDLFIVSSFGIIFDKKILNHPRLDVINIHPGVLPNYRGRHPLPQAILNKEQYMGITSHIMNLEIDRGEILNIIKLPIDYSKNYKNNEYALLEKLPDFVVQSIDNYLNKKYFVLSGKEVYYKPLKKEIINQIFKIKKLEDII